MDNVPSGANIWVLASTKVASVQRPLMSDPWTEAMPRYTEEERAREVHTRNIDSSYTAAWP